MAYKTCVQPKQWLFRFLLIFLLSTVFLDCAVAKSEIEFSESGENGAPLRLGSVQLPVERIKQRRAEFSSTKTRPLQINKDNQVELSSTPVQPMNVEPPQGEDLARKPCSVGWEHPGQRHISASAHSAEAEDLNQGLWSSVSDSVEIFVPDIDRSSEIPTRPVVGARPQRDPWASIPGAIEVFNVKTYNPSTARHPVEMYDKKTGRWTPITLTGARLHPEKDHSTPPIVGHAAKPYCPKERDVAWKRAFVETFHVENTPTIVTHPVTSYPRSFDNDNLNPPISKKPAVSYFPDKKDDAWKTDLVETFHVEHNNHPTRKIAACPVTSCSPKVGDTTWKARPVEVFHPEVVHAAVPGVLRTVAPTRPQRNQVPWAADFLEDNDRTPSRASPHVNSYPWKAVDLAGETDSFEKPKAKTNSHHPPMVADPVVRYPPNRDAASRKPFSVDLFGKKGTYPSKTPGSVTHSHPGMVDPSRREGAAETFNTERDLPQAAARASSVNTHGRSDASEDIGPPLENLEFHAKLRFDARGSQQGRSQTPTVSDVPKLYMTFSGKHTTVMFFGYEFPVFVIPLRNTQNYVAYLVVERAKHTLSQDQFLRLVHRGVVTAPSAKVHLAMSAFSARFAVANQCRTYAMCVEGSGGGLQGHKTASITDPFSIYIVDRVTGQLSAASQNITVLTQRGHCRRQAVANTFSLNAQLVRTHTDTFRRHAGAVAQRLASHFLELRFEGVYHELRFKGPQTYPMFALPPARQYGASLGNVTVYVVQYPAQAPRDEGFLRQLRLKVTRAHRQLREADPIALQIQLPAFCTTLQRPRQEGNGVGLCFDETQVHGTSSNRGAFKKLEIMETQHVHVNTSFVLIFLNTQNRNVVYHAYVDDTLAQHGACPKVEGKDLVERPDRHQSGLFSIRAVIDNQQVVAAYYSNLMATYLATREKGVPQSVGLPGILDLRYFAGLLLHNTARSLFPLPTLPLPYAKFRAANTYLQRLGVHSSKALYRGTGRGKWMSARLEDAVRDSDVVEVWSPGELERIARTAGHGFFLAPDVRPYEDRRTLFDFFSIQPKWHTAFERSGKRAAFFSKFSKNAFMTTVYMYMNGNLTYVETAGNCIAFKLPIVNEAMPKDAHQRYRDAVGHLDMYVIAPQSIDASLPEIDAHALWRIQASLHEKQPEEVEILLPAFHLKGTYEVTADLAFTMDRIQQLNIPFEKTNEVRLLQMMSVCVDQTGVKQTSRRPYAPATLKRIEVNRPFKIAILKNGRFEPLFVGHVQRVLGGLDDCNSAKLLK